MPRSTRRVVTCSVPSRARRCGHAARAIAVADRVRPGARHLGEHARVRDACRAERAADRAVEPLHQPSRTAPGDTARSCAGASGSASAPVAVTSVWPTRRRDASLRSRAAVGVELGQRVVEQEERRDAALVGEELGLGEEQREDRQPLLALGAERPQVALARQEADLVEVRAEAGRSALEVAGEPRLEARASAARRRRRAMRPSSPSSAARSANAGARSSRPRRRASTSSPRASTTCSVQGSSASGAGEAGADTPKRGVPLAERGGVGDGQVGAGGQQRGRARGRSRRGAPPGRP